MEAEPVTATTHPAWPAGSESPGTKSARAFTLIELLVTIACVVLTVAVLLPALAKTGRRVSHANCGGYLKQIALSFRSWAIDHNNQFPMQVSVVNGGTMELTASGAVFPHFQAVSNELNTPKILHCPADKSRRWATNFTSDFTDKHLSYFLNMDSVRGDGSSLLSGDRHITNRASAGSRVVNLTKGTAIGWTKEFPVEQGYLVFGDEHVQGYTRRGVSTALQIPSGVTNRLAVP